MDQLPQTIAAHVRPDTAGLWARFLTLSRAMGLTNSKALAQAAELWLANTRPDPFQGPARVPLVKVWCWEANDYVLAFEDGTKVETE